ncbi:VP5 [American grass carp reovirus]|uniref:Microtubule-associated protein VP5 n=1 Tax=Aquareovirus G (isolate American grass carp/USA/PB01-155/-) TaxID=648234 RepID=VP5_AQRVG|nr:VP5 [American grass carp reovirus]B2BNE3.1 RecName: Full=Microtubule-associated protein VP5 [American grass carp reovirus PB01-155]ABV01043.1 VP5 [American grass carp reovirus]
MITIVVIPTERFPWTDTNLLNSIDYRLNNIPKSNQRFAVYAPAWLRLQLEEAAVSLTPSQLLAAIQDIHVPVTSTFALLPKAKRFAQWLLDDPSSNIWHIPVTVLNVTATSKHPTSDIFNYVVGHVSPNAELATTASRVSGTQVVYTRTSKVLGAPLRLAAPTSYYSGYLSSQQLSHVYPSSWTPETFKKKEICFTILPSLTSPKTFLLDVDAPRDPSFPLSVMWPLLRNDAVKSHRLMPPNALLRRTVDPALKPEWSADVDPSFRALRLSRPRGANTSSCHNRHHVPVCDIQCALTPEPLNDSEKPPATHITIHAVPSDLLTVLDITVGKEYPLRLESGMYVPWMLMSLLMSDDVTLTGTRRSVKLETAHAAQRPFTQVKILRCVSARVTSVRAGPATYLNAVCLTLPKGSFKSTMIDTLPSLFPEWPVVSTTAIVDSDHLGDSLDPTFEQRFATMLETLPPGTVDQAIRVALATCPTADETALQLIVTSFNELYASCMTEAQRNRVPILTQQGRTLVFAHSDYEMLAANVPIQVIRGAIPIDHTVNIIARPNRVGGTALQLLLDYCYRMQASPIATMPAGALYRQLFGPWLRAKADCEQLTPVSLIAEVPARVMRAAGWTIQDDMPLIINVMRCYRNVDDQIDDVLTRTETSRAIITISADGIILVEYAPPLPLITLPSSILLPATYTATWLEPPRILLTGSNVSVTSGLSWAEVGSPLDVPPPGV